MKSHVAIFNTHDHAIDAIERLSEKHFPVDKLSMIERKDTFDNQIKVKSLENTKIIPLAITTLIGLILGMLTSLDVISVPGLKFLEAQPLFIASFVGFDIGLIAGTFIIIAIALFVKRDKRIKMNKQQEKTSYVLVVDGSEKEIELAESILHTKGTHDVILKCTYCNARSLQA
jgi:hypothetical protein